MPRHRSHLLGIPVASDPEQAGRGRIKSLEYSLGMQRAISIFDTPSYSGPQAAHYAGVPYATLRNWILEHALITPPEPNHLSFNNLAEAHVLKSMRSVHKLSLQAIRRALDELASIRKTAHPLLDQAFETDGVDLCIRQDDCVYNLSQGSQQEFREFVALYLHRIERDASGKAMRLYPFVTRHPLKDPKHVSISPTVSFGRPVVTGTGISTAVIAGRFAARDSLTALAQEYQVTEAVLEDVIRWEMLRAKAA